MKKLILVFFFFVSIISGKAQQVWNGTIASDYAGGNGSSEYPYLIESAEQLAKLANDVNIGTNWSDGKYFKLIADIALNQNLLNTSFAVDTTGKNVRKWIMIGYYNTDIDYKAFMGMFDGNGHTIRGIYVNDFAMSYGGLFRYVEKATIKNLGIIDSYFYGNANVAAVAGIIKNATVINCYNISKVDGGGSYHAGIVGNAIGKSVVANCYNLGLINGKNNTSGIVSRNGVSADGALVFNCYNAGIIQAAKTNKAGIVAENNTGSFVNTCYFLNTATTTGVYAGSGASRNVISKTKDDLSSNLFLTLLNDTSKVVPLACRWILKDTIPVHDYNIFTEDNTGKVDVSKQANGPIPLDGEIHADADNGSAILRWKPAINGRTVKHFIYFSEDSLKLVSLNVTDTLQSKASLALKDTSYTVNAIYSMQTYFWRVDQLDNTGLITRGQIWSFHPRHLAFKEAEGYGRFALGGRGGKVVYVTNLNDAGPGSFRDAVTANMGPRTVIFNVSGLITLSSRLIMRDHVTVAGQTAPGKGICFRAAPVGVSTESICRFVRMRLGAGTTYDGMGMAGVNNGIIDHCSISWTIDESFSSRYAKNITLQRTLISEALNIAGHQNYPAGTAHGYAGSISGDIGSFHHNLLAHNEGRNWSLAGGLDGNAYYTGRMDIFNIVVYNWGGRATDGGAHEVNFVNNYYKKGAATAQNTVLKAQLEGTGRGSQSYYYAGNIEENTNGTLACDGTDNTCSRTYTLSNGQIVNWDVFVNKPFFPSYANIQSAKDAYKSVMSDVGCTLPAFDEHDKRIVRETLTGTYTYKGSISGKAGLIDHQDDAGGYENYPEETRPEGFDTDGDGLPDWWEKLHGTNPNSALGDFSDSNADTDKDGYTALEEYLDWMAVPHFNMTENVSDTIDLAALTAGYTKSPSFATVNAKNLTVKYLPTSVVIKPNSKSAGINYFDFMVTDADGSSMVRTLGIYVIANDKPTLTNKIVENTKEQQFEVYPVLFDNQLNILAETEASKSIVIALVDLNGRELFRKDFDIQGGYYNLQLDCPANLPSQIYLLKIMDKRTGIISKVKRVVKK